MLDPSAIQGLRSQLRGELIEPEHAGYDAARKVYNAMIDRYPRLIVRCADVADVIACVRFARDQDLLLAIRGGGHNGGGLGVCDNGLVIDLSRMRGVRVDPAAQRSVWRAAAPGATSITPPTRSASQRRAASSPRPASAGSRWAAASAT